MGARGKPRRYVLRCYEQRVAYVQRACRRIEGGETLTEICRDPTMPQVSTMRFWLNNDAQLGEMMARAEAQAAQFFPPRRDYHRFDEAVAAEVLARIEDGRGIREVCAEPDMPVHATVYRWMRERPDFEQAYRQAREAQADRLFDLAWKIACEATDATVRTDRLKIQTLKHRIGKLAPRRYGPLKAQAPEGAEPTETTKTRKETRFYIRHFATTPERKVVEITEAVWGKSQAEIAALHDGIGTGAIGLEALAAMKRKTLEDLGEADG